MLEARSSLRRSEKKNARIARGTAFFNRELVSYLLGRDHYVRRKDAVEVAPLAMRRGMWQGCDAIASRILAACPN
jgi:hypothetical protein